MESKQVALKPVAMIPSTISLDMVDGFICSTISFAGKKIKIYGTHDTPWFCGSDAAAAISYADTQDAVKAHVPANHKRTLADILGPGDLPTRLKLDKNALAALYIDEAGIYRLIMKSKKKEALPFQEWVTAEVLPSIRKTGSYTINAQMARLTSELASQRLLLESKEAEMANCLAMTEEAKLEARRANRDAVRQQAQAEKQMRLAKKQELRAAEYMCKSIEYKRRAEETKRAMDEKEEMLNNIFKYAKDMLSCKKYGEPQQSLYIVSSESYSRQGTYKIGQTKDMDARHFGHNNTRVGPDKVAIVKECKVANAAALEKYMHAKLEPLRITNTKEFFQCPFWMLRDITTTMVDFDNHINMVINEAVDKVLELHKQKFAAPEWSRGLDPTIFPNDDIKEPLPSPSKYSIITCVTPAERMNMSRKVLSGYLSEQYGIDIDTPADFFLFESAAVNRDDLLHYFRSNITHGQKSKFISTEWRPLFDEIIAQLPNIK
jgi:prophage antirepressor-like protein